MRVKPQARAEGSSGFWARTAVPRRRRGARSAVTGLGERAWAVARGQLRGSSFLLGRTRTRQRRLFMPEDFVKHILLTWNQAGLSPLPMMQFKFASENQNFEKSELCTCQRLFK